MPNKIIFVSNTANFSKFNRPFMRWFKEQGWQVDYASMGEEQVLDCDNQYAVPMTRSPFNLKNLKAYKKLKALLIDNDYDIIHCHTPMGGFLTRIAARKSRAKVIYTAHGFHFYNGAPFLNWLIYYPIEKYLIKYTGCLITINHEDFVLAQNKFQTCPIFLINGVGIDLEKFFPRNRNEKMSMRRELGFDTNDFIITNVAEINKNKNQIMLVKALPEIKKHIPNLNVLFIGNDNYPKVKALVNQLDLNDVVKFLGYRHDINKLTAISNVAFSASIREGLPVNIMEAMASGIPLVCSKNRGHNSIIIDRVSGLLFSPENPEKMIKNLISIYESPELADRLASAALKDSTTYSVNTAVSKMADIYKCFIH
jgi:glycosyltransferase EpsD